MEKEELLNNLAQFTGTEYYYKHFTSGKYTDGVKFLAEKANCYWLLDAIFSYNRKEHFQLWKLRVNNHKGVLTMQEDSDTLALITQEFDYTDFPLVSIDLYLIDNILILPGEY